MAKIKEINRTIRFDSRDPKSTYRCKYGKRNDFDTLRVNIIFDGEIKESYEIDSHFLPLTDSIRFKARETSKGFEVYDWTAVVVPYLRKL